MNTEQISIEAIKPYQRNNKKHSKEQIQFVANSIKDFGFNTPIILDKDNVIIAGHCRLEAAKLLNLDTVPTIKKEDLTPEQVSAYRIADNKLTELGEWDLGNIDLEITDLLDIGFPIEDYGLADFIKEDEPEVSEDEFDENPDEIFIKEGDLIELGEHRVLCGDSTKEENYQELMQGEKADMVFTDPPYGINEKGDRRKRNGKNSLRKGVQYDDFKDDSTSYAIDAYNHCNNLDINIQVWFGANYYCHTLPESNNWLVWDKRVEDKQRDLNSDCELAWVKSNKNSIRIFRHIWKGLIKNSEHGVARVHPTQKPVALCVFAINEYNKEANSVLDPFLGSGSTLIACEQLNRKCYGIELEPKYCQVILNRYIKYCEDNDKKPNVKINGEDFK